MGFRRVCFRAFFFFLPAPRVLLVKMVKHNNVLPNVHLRKYWQRKVVTWLNQPARKQRRRTARAEKAVKVFPRPVSGLLRPVVHSMTQKYNMKVRFGRGFTLEELKEAGINRHEARGVGIAVDHRRKNRSEKSLKENVQRLKVYKSKLVVFPLKAGKRKAGDSTKEECDAANQVVGTVLPIVRSGYRASSRAITEADTKASAFSSLRRARADARLVGVRQKRAEAKAAEEAQKIKKGK
eukprot:TRINITY_DN17113_c0_g1_i1.p2 TRINITY_DN17113_c0_g1~~TRINITY_DN17113_c0_g1_i1.p2  ORF type:complete len:238 (-),score=62.83 TRINITY_DN17113_c0_g1_i1:86-799(-)